MKLRGVIPIVNPKQQQAVQLKLPRSSLVAANASLQNMPGYINSANNSDLPGMIKPEGWDLNFKELVFDNAQNCKWRGKPVAIVYWPTRIGIQVKNALEHSKDPIKAKKLAISNPPGYNALAMLDLLANLRHPNLLLFMGAFTEDSRMGLVYEHLGDHTLYQQLVSSSLHCEWDAQVQILLDIASAISFLHGAQPPLYHRYLSSKSVVLNGLISKVWYFISVFLYPGKRLWS